MTVQQEDPAAQAPTATVAREEADGLPGRRVDRIADLGMPCDYAVMRDDSGAIRALWFILPNGVQGRISAEGHKQRHEPTWTITEADGLVTVDPSIDLPAGAKSTPWHGWLRSGVWYPA